MGTDAEDTSFFHEHDLEKEKGLLYNGADLKRKSHQYPDGMRPPATMEEKQ